MGDYHFDHTRDDHTKTKIYFDHTRDTAKKGVDFDHTRDPKKEPDKKKEAEFKPVPPPPPKPINYKKIILGLCTIIFVVIVCTVIIKLNDPVQKISRYLSNQKYHEAVECYNSRIYGHSAKEDKSDILFTSCMDSMENDYYNETLEYSIALNAFTEFTGLDKGELSDQASSAIEDMDANEDIKEIFSNAESKYVKKEYLLAMSLYTTIPETFLHYDTAQDHYISSREILLKPISSPKTEEDYLNCLDIVNGYLDVVKSDDMFIKRKNELEKGYNNLITDAKRQQILADAKAAFEDGEYEKAFALLEAGIKELSSDSTLSKQLEEYHKQYITLVTNVVNAYTEKGDFSDALDNLSAALKIYNCKEFKELEESVYSAKEDSLNTYNGNSVNFEKKSGSINSDDDVDTYTMTADREGIYCLTFSEMQYGFEVKVRILNHLNEEVASGWKSNGESLPTKSIPKGKYTIEVSHSSDTGSYEFTIGHQKSIVDANMYAIINDSIEYDDQVNNYKFAPEYSGVYRFEFSNLLYDTEIHFGIYDHLNTPIKEQWISGKEGVTVDSLIANEKYTISISQGSGLTQYTMDIGRQKPTRIIEAGQKVNGQIQFVNQNDFYSFVPTSTRTYAIVGTSANWNDWYIKIYDENNNPLNLENTGDASLSVELTADKKYTICCYYDDTFTDYSFTIN